MSEKPKLPYEVEGARLLEARERLKLTQQQMADAAGVGKRTYCYYEAGERQAPSDLLKSLAKIGVNPSYQLFGDGPVLLRQSDVPAAVDMLDRALHDDRAADARSSIRATRFVQATKANLAGYELADTPSPSIAEMDISAVADDFVLIPSLGIRAGASRGKIAIYEPKAPLAFQRSWFARKKLNPLHCGTIEISGPSMEGLLFDGDTVVLHRKDVTIRSGKTYAFRLGDEIMVKHLHWLPGGSLKVISENKSFEPFVITPDQLLPESFDLIGRVRGSSHDWD